MRLFAEDSRRRGLARMIVPPCGTRLQRRSRDGHSREGEDPLGRLAGRPGMDRVADQHEPHRPVSRSWLGKLVP
jgi:hypothetical protein